MIFGWRKKTKSLLKLKIKTNNDDVCLEFFISRLQSRDSTPSLCVFPFFFFLFF